jgi:hypothetical protein
MTIDWTKPIETIDGEPVRVLATDLDGMYPVAVAIMRNEVQHLSTRTFGGLEFIRDGETNLRNVPPKPVVQEVFISFHPRPCMAAPLGPSTGYCFLSAEDAERCGRPDSHDADPRRALIKVVITDGVVTDASLHKN